MTKCSCRTPRPGSAMINDTLEKGPQIITRCGIDTAVVISVEEWRKLREEERPTWENVQLGIGRDSRFPLPKRGAGRWRKPVVFD
jgi:antitoxin Phd